MYNYNPYYGTTVPMYRNPHQTTYRTTTPTYIHPCQVEEALLQRQYEEELHRRRQAEHLRRIQALREQEEREKAAMVRAEMERRKMEYLRRVKAQQIAEEEERRRREVMAARQRQQQQQQQMLREKLIERERQQRQQQPQFRWFTDFGGVPGLWVGDLEEQPIGYEDEEMSVEQPAPAPAPAPTIPAPTPIKQTHQPQPAPPKPFRIPVRTPPPKVKPTPGPEQVNHLYLTANARKIQRAYRTHLINRRLAAPKLALLNTVASSLSSLISTHRHAALTTPLKRTASGAVELGVKENMAFLGYEEQLVKLMIQADGVESEGLKSVRERRREVVKAIQEELDGVDRRRRDVGKEGVSSTTSDSAAEEVTANVEVETSSSGLEKTVEGSQVDLKEGQEGETPMDVDAVEAVKELLEDAEASEHQVCGVQDVAVAAESSAEVQHVPTDEMDLDKDHAHSSGDEGWEVLSASNNHSSESEREQPSPSITNTPVPDFHESSPEPAPDILSDLNESNPDPTNSSANVNAPFDQPISPTLLLDFEEVWVPEPSSPLATGSTESSVAEESATSDTQPASGESNNFTLEVVQPAPGSPTNDVIHTSLDGSESTENDSVSEKG
ncbi:hypothetical protein HK097_008101 [Rhizophlyctis rosea]|uniref:BAG domain-containing protein n=1 Tax=Rhizophlyctis rosea TaxID=64517 RepID=A0AAD5X195_9FUNG|nr:hypothetical protein HK097_008101 [Rhizophlyctis rosea]